MLRTILTSGCLLLCGLPGLRAAETIDFQRDIRPILSNSCFQCHGPDAEHREADLRLDQRQSAFADRDGQPALVPGRPQNSIVWQRISATDPDIVMPPPDSGKSLNPSQRDLIRQWIEQGARWSEHWAFVAPESPQPPDVRHTLGTDESWLRNPIDRFVLSRLEQLKLHPAPAADPRMLVRRLSLDLTGLPPSPELIREVIERPELLEGEAIVDRLLASDHYGERWARHWLDAARYADSDGFEKDKPRRVWFYRDWVIKALNRDLPYDQFIIEQLAGDLLPGATQDQIVATGFLRNSMINEEGGVDPEQFRMEAMFDRMDAIGKSVLGLTIQCSQCHHHKFDPMTQEEYYRLFAFLNNAHEGNIAVYSAEQQREIGEIEKQVRQIEQQLQRDNPDWPQQLAAWEAELPKPTADWHTLSLEFDDTTLGGQKFLPQPDGSYLAQGYAPTKHRPRMSATPGQRSVTAFRLELLNDPNLPLGGPGRSLRGTGALSEFQVEVSTTGQPDKWTMLKFREATADLNLPAQPLDDIYSDRSKTERVTGPIAMAIDGDDKTAWGIETDPRHRNQPRNAVFVLQEPLELTADQLLRVTLKQLHGGWNSDDNQNNNLGRFRISVSSARDAAADPFPAGVRQALATPADQRSARQRQQIFSAWRRTVPEFESANARIAELWNSHPQGSAQLVLLERDRSRTTNVLMRGDFLKPQQSVEPGVPEFLHSLPEDAPRNRLGLARWLVDRRSPTTARALVNRVWQAYFGTGLVSTPEDLGSQSAAPSHPELLDWLAVDFMDHGWSLKHLHRRIVTSSTYRQSSHITAEALERDPQNRWLARGARFRVEAEVVRDVALSVSGLLDPQVGGASVYPPAPEFLFQPPASYGPKVWKSSDGDQRYRRALYTFRYRSVPYPALEAFDAPNGDFSCVRRARSNTPLQALTMLNEPLFMECAVGLARRMISSSVEHDRERLAVGFELCTTRQPDRHELLVLQQLLARQRERIAAGELDVARLLEAAGEAAAGPGETGELAKELAAWTVVARVLLNLDETISRP